MNKVEALRAKLQEAASKSDRSSKTRSSGDGASFPFWNTPEGQSSIIRFLPDGNQDNPFFWVERQVIKMPFEGVVGGDYPTQNRVEVTVPCMDMFGKQCPIIAATKKYWDGDDADKEIARTYWKKRSYIFQGFVVDTPINEDETPENPIRRFVINKSIFDIVHASLLEPNFEHLPCDFEGGRDFKVTKTKKGQWANYSTSNWSFATRSLGEEERAAIETHGLFNLSEALGAEPDEDGIAAIKAMFEDSIAGNPFDYDSYGQYYRPYQNNRARNNDSVAKTATTMAATPAAAPAATPAPAAPAAAAEPAAEVATTGATDKQSAQDILARLRANSQK